MDFSDAADPTAAMGGGGASPYMKDLAEKLSFIKSDILSLYSVQERSQQWFVNGVKTPVSPSLICIPV